LEDQSDYNGSLSRRFVLDFRLSSRNYSRRNPFPGYQSIKVWIKKMGMFDPLLLGFKISLSSINLFYAFVGVILGTVVGVLPGLGPAGTMALLLPITLRLNVTGAIIMLSGIYYGVSYGGTLTSVLMKIPGEASTVVTCIDGYEMAKKGRAGPALGISAFGSFIGSTVGIIAICFLAGPLSLIALKFSPMEFTSLMIFGLSLVTYLSSKSLSKSMAMTVIGLILGCIGIDPIKGVERFDFGTLTLLDGIGVVPLGMGLFGIAEIFILAEESEVHTKIIKTSMRIRNLLPTKQDWKDSIGPIARGTPLGFFLGVLPGGGAVMSSFFSYALEKRVSRHPEKFGTGAIEGVAGPETANNSGTAGAFLPLLTLGVPFNIITALILAAFMVHGVTPGPMILNNHPEIFWGVVTSMYIGNAMLLILNLPMIGLFVNILKIPKSILSPLIGVVCFIGVYSLNNNPADVVVMLIFGLVGYLMRKFDYEPAPLVMAFVIGPMLELSLRQSLLLSDGSIAVFFKRPACAAFLSITIIFLMLPLLRMGYSYLKSLLLRRV
jgi:putative tricarboxylic transport membrane protein